jgi:prepilin-type N-terminal cleavage/methylation domain-containing protein
MNMRPADEKSFTLLELLVVITIIGILSSIVIVSMSGSTDSASIAKGKAYAQQVHALLGHEAVLDLSFNETAYDTCSGSSDVCDVSGYGNHGTIYNNEASFVSSPIDGNALSFDGVNDRIDCGNKASLFPASTYSWEFWTKIDSAGAGTLRYYWNKRWGSSNGDLLFIRDSNSKLEWWLGNGVATQHIYSNSALPTNSWMHIVGTYNGTAMNMYINSICQIDKPTLAGPITYPGISNFLIGQSSLSINGLIDDVRIYSEALPSTEIKKHYVQGLEKLLTNQAITQSEYDQRMEEFNQSLASI